MRRAWLLSLLLALAAAVVLVSGLRVAAAGEREALRRGESDLASRLRGEAAQAGDALRAVVQRTRDGNFAELPFPVSVVTAEHAPRAAGAPAAGSAALARAEQLEFVAHDAAGALAEYRGAAVHATAPDERACGLRNAARLVVALASRAAAPSGPGAAVADSGGRAEVSEAARAEALSLLTTARDLPGVGDREALLAAHDAADLGGEAERQRLVADLEQGRYAGAPPGERLALHARLGGDPARCEGLAALAAVLDGGAPEAVVRVGAERLAWRLRESPPRAELAVASMPAALSALLPGCAAGEWELARPAAPPAAPQVATPVALEAAPSLAMVVPLPAPFPSLALRPTPRALAAVAGLAADGERGSRTAASAVALALLAAAVLWLLDARRRAELERRKDAFVCSVTHELRTPIANILLFAETLRDHGRQDPDKVERFAGVIGAEAGLLRARVDEVLDVASGRRLVAVHGEMLPARVLREVAEESRERLAAAGMALELSVEDGTGRVRGSEDLLRRALSGLVDNARKHAARGTLRLSLRRQGSSQVITVEDEGPGVPAAERERVFEPFVRLGDEMTRTVPGTGLGLTLVRQCVELCGGRVVVLPREGGGACFRITLPELPAARREAGDAGSSRVDDAGGDVAPARALGAHRSAAGGDGDADHPAG